MDSTVIQEIANQLGMAVDQAGQFITENLPDFAGLKAMQAIVPMAILWTVFIVLDIVSITSYITARRSAAKAREEGNRYRSDIDDYMSFWVFIYTGTSAIVDVVLALFATSICAPELIGWSQYPQAMLIDMALKAI